MDYITLWPLESAEYIAKNADQVTVNIESCKGVAIHIMDACVDGTIAEIEYKANPLHPAGLSDEQHLNWTFVLDTLNFSFWPDDGEQYDVTYNGKKETGYLAMCAAFMKAHDAGINITDATWMETVNKDDLNEMLKSDSGHPIPLLFDRVRVLRESGKFLNEQYKGQFLELLKAADGRVSNLLRIILKIESFRDMALYKKCNVSLLKRAQILIADTWGLLKGNPELREHVAFPDLYTLTMFADYRVPQVLCYFDCIDYKEILLDKVKNNELLLSGEPYEVEIRGCSIFAVNEIYKECVRLREAGYKGKTAEELRCLFPIDIDVWLWQYRRDHPEVDTLMPFHRTRYVYY